MDIETIMYNNWIVPFLFIIETLSSCCSRYKSDCLGVNEMAILMKLSTKTQIGKSSSWRRTYIKSTRLKILFAKKMDNKSNENIYAFETIKF